MIEAVPAGFRKTDTRLAPPGTSERFLATATEAEASMIMSASERAAPSIGA
jgi:hypothetical protein